MLSIKMESIILIKYIKNKETFACFPFANGTGNYFQPNTNRRTQVLRKAFSFFLYIYIMKIISNNTNKIFSRFYFSHAFN